MIARHPAVAASLAASLTATARADARARHNAIARLQAQETDLRAPSGG